MQIWFHNQIIDLNAPSNEIPTARAGTLRVFRKQKAENVSVSCSKLFWSNQTWNELRFNAELATQKNTKKSTTECSENWQWTWGYYYYCWRCLILRSFSTSQPRKHLPKTSFRHWVLRIGISTHAIHQKLLEPRRDFVVSRRNAA